MPKIRYPLVSAMMSRDGAELDKDTYVRNGYVEKYGEKLYVMKRPGTEAFTDVTPPSNPQGVVAYNGIVYMVYGDIMYRTAGIEFVGADGMAWTQAPVPTWYGRSFFTATVFQNRIYVIGGEAPQLRADVSYTSDGISWSTNAGGAPFGHRQGHATVVFNDRLYLIGGLENDSTIVAPMNDVWVSDDGATWTRVVEHAEWAPRVNMTVVVANNGMYLYGGDFGGGLASDECWFSVDGETWTNLTLAATGTARYVHSMLAYHNKLWIIGGVDGAITPLNDVWSSPDGQTWTLMTAAAFPAGRYDMAATVYNDNMWLIAGVGGITIDANVYVSNNGVVWSLQTATPGFSNRGGCAAVVFQTPTNVSANHYRTLWLLGGNNGSMELQEVWRANLDMPLPAAFTLSPASSGLYYDFNTFMLNTKLLIKNPSNFWVLESGVLTKVVDTDYPVTTVPGIVVLNSFAYVMTPEGEIRACELENPLHWPSLQFIDANYEDDPGVAIIKYLNYLVAFGTYTTQFFYDAGNPAPGIPLSPYQAASYRVGCGFADTVRNVKNTIMWVGQTQQREWGVYAFDGLTPKKVSASWVDRIINDNIQPSPISIAFVTGNAGHTFYVLNLGSAAPSLAYDFDMGFWSVWNDEFQGVQLHYSHALSLISYAQNVNLLFGRNALAGQVYIVDFNITTDDGTPFKFVVQTDKIDGGNLERKFWGRLDFVADVNPGATVLVEVTDDDYNSYTTWGTVDLSRMRPYLNRGGSSRRRALRLTQTDAASARWEAVELTASQGES